MFLPSTAIIVDQKCIGNGRKNEKFPKKLEQMQVEKNETKIIIQPFEVMKKRAKLSSSIIIIIRINLTFHRGA